MVKERPRVFVKSGVVEGVTEDMLQRHFSAFGAVTDVYIPRARPSLVPKGFAYITFESEDSARRVVKDPVHKIEGHHFPVGMAEPRPPEKFDQHHKDQIDQHHKEQKRFKDLDLPTWPVTRSWQFKPGIFEPSPYLVNGASQEADFRPSPGFTSWRTDVLAGSNKPMFGSPIHSPDINDHRYGSTVGRIDIPQGLPANYERKERRIFVGGLPDALTENDLKTHFTKYGIVEDIYFPKQKSSAKKRRFCYIRFSSSSSADAAAARSPRTIAGHDIGEIKVAEARPPISDNAPLSGPGYFDYNVGAYTTNNFDSIAEYSRTSMGRPTARYRPY